MPEVRLTETISTTVHDITEEERKLASDYNAFLADCIRWARKQILHGNHTTRLTLARTAITASSRLAMLDTKTQQEEHRLAFQALLSEMTTIDAPSTPALAEPVEDQDEDT